MLVSPHPLLYMVPGVSFTQKQPRIGINLKLIASLLYLPYKYLALQLLTAKTKCRLLVTAHKVLVYNKSVCLYEGTSILFFCCNRQTPPLELMTM